MKRKLTEEYQAELLVYHTAEFLFGSILGEQAVQDTVVEMVASGFEAFSAEVGLCVFTGLIVVNRMCSPVQKTLLHTVQINGQLFERTHDLGGAVQRVECVIEGAENSKAGAEKGGCGNTLTPYRHPWRCRRLHRDRDAPRRVLHPSGPGLKSLFGSEAERAELT